jgi:outer membrane protein OmpA-like peptidoglycan-associated protein
LFILTGLTLMSGCEGSLVKAESVAQAPEQTSYWTPALQARSEQLLAQGVGPVAKGNVRLYKAAVARELRTLAGQGIEVEEDENMVTLRLSSELAFAVGSAELAPAAVAQLAACAPVFVAYGMTVLEISGHTDSTGSAQANLGLSEARARAVAGFLEARGVSPMRMVVEGRSDTRPLADNVDEQGRRLNRRVEIRALPLTGGDKEVGTGDELTRGFRPESRYPGADRQSGSQDNGDSDE